jgi:hypothetical protein
VEFLEEYNLQDPTNIFSWDSQMRMNAKMEEGTSVEEH